jgi:hypothetical protein
MADFAERYADLNEQDHAAHERAIAEGRIDATLEPGRQIATSAPRDRSSAAPGRPAVGPA